MVFLIFASTSNQASDASFQIPTYFPPYSVLHELCS